MIYKTLGLRHKVLPLFLTKNLSYMHGRSKIPRKNVRKLFRVDNILNQVLEKNRELMLKHHENITLSVIEICSPSAADCKSVSVEVSLLNCEVGKVSSSYINSSDKIYVGSCTNVPMVKIFQNGPTVASNTFSLHIANFYKNFVQNNEWTFCFEVNVNAREKFVGVLPIFSTSLQCNSLVDGVYEIPLSSAVDFKLPTCDSPNGMSRMQVLKVQLAWVKEPAMPRLEAITKKELIQPSVRHTKVKEESEMETDVPQILYTFVWGKKNEHQSVSLQPTTVCPWCNLTCSQLYSLLKHLCVCHSRLNFVYKPDESSHHFVVEVTLNVTYDGSYEGNAWRLFVQPNKVFNGPLYRSSITEFLVWRTIPQPPPSLKEFLPTKTPVLPRRPNKIGHNRPYFHFTSWIPYISPKEMETESDNEGLEWHPEYSRQQMNEFRDVNEGEKAIMNEWNTFVSVNYKILAVNQVVPACQMFIQQCGPRLLKQKLYRNVVLHFTCLHDFGVLSATDLYQLVLELQQLASSLNVEHDEGDAMEIDDVCDNQQSSNSEELEKMTNQKNIEDMKQVALTPNTNAFNKKDELQSWETAYKHWLNESKKF